MAPEPHHIPSLAALTELAATHKYLILDFTAQWCPPCKAIAPLFAKLAAQHTIPNKLAFCKVDVDEAADVASKYAVTAMPTFLVLVDGEAVGVEVPATVTGGGVVRAQDGENKVVQVRGADPRGLLGVVEAVAGLARAEVEVEGAAAGAGAEEEKKEEEEVSSAAL